MCHLMLSAFSLHQHGLLVSLQERITALHVACRQGNIKLMKLLLRHVR